MSIRKNKYSVAKVLENGKVVCYLSKRDEERGFDSLLDSQGYTIVAL